MPTRAKFYIVSVLPHYALKIIVLVNAIYANMSFSVLDIKGIWQKFMNINNISSSISLSGSLLCLVLFKRIDPHIMLATQRY